MILTGKRLLITGVLTERSIAYEIARRAQHAGAEIVLTGFGRTFEITSRMAGRLPDPPPVLEMDVTDPDQMRQAAAEVGRLWPGGVDGIVHAVAYAPQDALGGGFLTAEWPSASVALHVSTYSFVAMSRTFAPLLAARGGGSIVGLDFDPSVAWPGYDWMGVAKAALESCCRYLARDLGDQGTRVNLVAAGPLRTRAALAIEDFPTYQETWQRRAPLGWDVNDPRSVATVVCSLLSDWMPSVTGDIIHVDGGAHAMGTDVRAASDGTGRSA